MCLLIVALTLSVGYVMLSYSQTRTKLQGENLLFLQQEQKEITTSLEELNQFLNLTESRLINSLDQQDKIPSILSFKPEHFSNQGFPEILNFTFTPFLDPKTVYSRFGIGPPKSEAPTTTTKDGFIYLGNGKVQLTKSLYDASKVRLGTLQITFSIGHLLYKHFSENEVNVLPISAKNIEGRLTFDVPGLPYVFLLNRSLPSFWEFLFYARYQILLILFFCLSALALGVAISSALHQKRIKKSRALLKNLKENFKVLGKEKTELLSQELYFKNLLKLRKTAQKEREQLFTSLQERYRQMAVQAHAINAMTSKLILEEAGNDKLLKEIHSVSQESNTVLRRLIDGYPMRGIEENIDVLGCIKNVKTLFLPEIIEKTVKVDIEGQIKASPKIDKVTFELIVHNIFHMIMGRLLKNNTVQIQLKDENPLKIIFYDDGYELGDKLQTAKQESSSTNIMCLDQNNLEDFATCLGWEVSFSTAGELSNCIALSIPLEQQANSLPTNVVNLFDVDHHAK